MSDNHQLLSPLLAGQQITDTTSPTSPKEPAPKVLFDSEDSRDVKGYFASPTDRFQRPRKATRKVTKQDLLSSPSTVDTGSMSNTPRENPPSPRNGNENEQTITSQSPPLLQNHSEHDGIASPRLHSSSPDGGKNDGDLTIRKGRPRSDFIEMDKKFDPEKATREELLDALFTGMADMQRAAKRISDLEKESDRENAKNGAKIASLEDDLTKMSLAKTAMARQIRKAQMVQKEVEDHSIKVIKENTKFEELNQSLRRETLKAQSKLQDCKSLDASQVSQIAKLNEDLSWKTNSVKNLEGELIKLSKDRAAEAALSLTISEAAEAFQRKNSALNTDLQAARNTIQEQQAEIEELLDDRAAEATQKLTIRETAEVFQRQNSALKTDLQAARNKIQEQQTELEATRLQIVQFNQQFVSPEEEFLQYDGAEASPSSGSPAHSPRWSNTLIRDPIRRDALIPTLEERRLSDTPALTDGASTRSTTSVASPPPIATPVPVDSAGPSDPTKSLPIDSDGPSENTDPVSIDTTGPSDLPKTQHQATLSTGPPNKFRDRQQKSVFEWWPSTTQDKKPYRIVGPRPKNLADVVEEARTPASTSEPTEIWEVIPPNQTSNAGTQTDSPPLIPPTIASNISTQTDLPPLTPTTTTSNARTQTDFPAPPVAALPPRSPAAAGGGRPMWHHVALGTSLLLFLIGHAVFVERRIWGGANELSRRAVVSMRDEWWGSPWIERVGYALDQTLAVDRTGFC
jgi:hypothetical protein